MKTVILILLTGLLTGSSAMLCQWIAVHFIPDYLQVSYWVAWGIFWLSVYIAGAYFIIEKPYKK